VDSITHAYSFPTYFNLDRDIVHGAAYELAEKRGLPLEPETVEDMVHDLYDAARFKVSRQIKMDALMEKLLERGADGLLGMVDAIAQERTTSRRYITEYQSDGYDATGAFREKLQAYSSGSPAGALGSVANDFDDLLGNRLLRHICRQFEKFKYFDPEDQLESRDYLETLVTEAVALVRPDLNETARQQAVVPPAHAGPLQQVRHWMDLAENLLGEGSDDREDELVGRMLAKLDDHPLYQEVFLAQVGELNGGAKLDSVEPRPSVESLYGLVPEGVEELSSDPDGVSKKLARFERLRRTGGDADEMLALLAGVLVRLDRAEDYHALTENLKSLGRLAEGSLIEIVEADATRAWQAMRQRSVFLLNELLE
jgi:hypothetical protein